MMKITGLSHLFKWENLHNWWLTKYFFCPTVYLRNTNVPGLTYLTCVLAPLSGHFSLKLRGNVQ